MTIESGISTVTVIGAGVLGGQIAWHSAFKGKHVMVFDINQEGLDVCQARQQGYADTYLSDVGASVDDIVATRARLCFTTDLATAVAESDLVIEAVPEIPEIKTSLYTDMAALLPPHTLIATNTSTLLPSMFAEATGRPEKFCSLHFANHIWLSNLTEIMAHETTDRVTVKRLVQFSIEIGMVPIPVREEQNGYVLNTWFVALLKSSMSLVVNGVATFEDVDRTFLITNAGTRMGPFGMADMVGMKTAFDVATYWGGVDGDEQWLKTADYIKTNFLDKGLQGALGGEGFYKYPNPAFLAADFLAVPAMSKVEEITNVIIPS